MQSSTPSIRLQKQGIKLCCIYMCNNIFPALRPWCAFNSISVKMFNLMEALTSNSFSLEKNTNNFVISIIRRKQKAIQKRRTECCPLVLLFTENNSL